jgi:hypothetical protein
LIAEEAAFALPVLLELVAAARLELTAVARDEARLDASALELPAARALEEDAATRDSLCALALLSDAACELAFDSLAAFFFAAAFFFNTDNF